jgi:hypothetical protein
MGPKTDSVPGPHMPYAGFKVQPQRLVKAHLCYLGKKLEKFLLFLRFDVSRKNKNKKNSTQIQFSCLMVKFILAFSSISR